MKRGRKPPVNIDPHEVVINVYPFDGEQAIVAWIDDGYLATVAGTVAVRCRVEIGPQTPLDADGLKLRKVADIVSRKGYRDAWVLHSDGTRTKLQAL